MTQICSFISKKYPEKNQTNRVIWFHLVQNIECEIKSSP